MREVFRAIPVDDDVAGFYGIICALTLRVGRKPRGARSFVLLIAATAFNHQRPLFTRNLADVEHLERLLQIVEV